ncbi:cupin domain-containing protein [Aliikangiella coralliicola]|uniref:Cupin domain-containing protein n=1 Tax=Aliikangiella coralliicola TaxID=2592383 RepID=A0A545UK64_9GAMM|nr:cupin domain-containing protein [Aliikangiella coralliicola]TQV89846.1 cupin domain-containing protein [Aliikangiella coralliicola]
MTKDDVIDSLNLVPHPNEGGYYRRTYESKRNINGDDGLPRKLLTSIYYLLTSDSPIGHLHKNCSDIVHFYHLGASIEYLIISPDGKVEKKILGPDIANGETPQLVVKGGYWKASQLHHGDFGLISEAVAPGFEYKDNEVATTEVINQLFPELVSSVGQFIKCEKTSREFSILFEF